MMKKYLSVICMLAICLSMLAGCQGKRLPDLPTDAIAFEMGSFDDAEHDHAWFGTIVYEGRTYIGYGTSNWMYKKDCATSCVGYIIQDENSSSVTELQDTNTRVYTIFGDDEHNFLMVYDATVPLMNQPDFWRAIDTKGKDIEIPKYIDSLGYEFWELMSKGGAS
ncbi:MAG: hypothetical protein ACSW8H_02150 [bacterium]